MPTRLVELVADANDPARLAAFWAAVFGWHVRDEGDGEFSIQPAGYSYPDPAAIPVLFALVPEPKTTKNRVHLDLATESEEHQQAEVARLLAMGATPASIGQAPDLPWQVLADPEGNEFCVLEPQPVYPSTGLFGGIVIDCADHIAAASFWEQATGWTRRTQGTQGVSLRSPSDTGPYLTLLKGPDDKKTVKNRIHPDVAPEKGEDQEAAVQRLLGIGATRATVSPAGGQGPDVSWVVMAAPDGSEFCVLTPR